MIYCGYQGSGKTTYCKNNPNTSVDLDSSNFVKKDGWEVGYIKIAREFSEHGKDVFISAHKVVIEYMLRNGFEFAILAPIENKQAWKARLEFRYKQNPILPNLKAIYDFEQNYDNDMEYYKSLEKMGVKVCWIRAKIKTNIDEFITR